MGMNKAEHQILRGTSEGGKTYLFNETYDSTKLAQKWFQESHEGLILFIVFYTQACRWSRCRGCNLPSVSASTHVGYRALIAQVDMIFDDAEVVARRGDIRKVIISNNGSVLDQETFSSTALMYLVARINMNLPNIACLAIETRPEYVEPAELEFLSRALKEGETVTHLELAVGFEIFDDRLRNEVFLKGLKLEIFEDLVRGVGAYGYTVKVYFMLKPVVGMSDDEAVADVHGAIDYLSSLSQRHGVPINVHLNPTYVATGTPLAEAFARGEYSPPRLADVARAAVHAQGTGLSVFLGLYDEGLAVEGGSFIRPGEEQLVERLERFNKCQDFSLLRP